MSIPAPEEVSSRAEAMFQAERSSDLRELIAQKLNDLRHYDVEHMDRVASILCWGRSGSLLLASYLDGHEDVIVLPGVRGSGVYEFFDRYPSMSLREKLIGYAAAERYYPQFFEGDFAISRSHYYAAVEAILERYRDWPADFLDSRRAFFLLVHIAYNLALGKRPSARPLIVWAQHFWDDKAARWLIENFPQSKFVHTIRDPLSSYNSLVRAIIEGISRPDQVDSVYRHAMLGKLTVTDRAHPGMESRTRCIRLEDLHRDPAGTMRGLSEWLGIPYRTTLVDSTFNGIPYLYRSRGKTWCGQNSALTQRIAPDLTRRDRVVLSALFYEDFQDWNYPCPKFLGNSILRCMVVACLFLFPLNTEIIAAREVWKRRIRPALPTHKFSRVMKSLAGIALVRLKIMWLLVSVVPRRCVRRPILLRVEPSEHFL